MRSSIPRRLSLLIRCCRGIAIAGAFAIGEPLGAQAPLPGWMPARVPCGGAMAYDVARQRVVVFGGFSSVSEKSYADTWEWDGSTWAQRSPATSPSARMGHAMAYDLARQRVVLFGGVDTTTLADTWEWDGNDWTKRTPATSPGPRTGHAMAYDLARQRIVLFGGSRSVSLVDTWEWDGSTWAQRSPAASPSARYDHAMAYDVARQRVVLFGGSGTATFADTWEWNGSNWLQRTPLKSPSARSDHAMAYDVVRQRVVLFGGFGPGGFADTWEWDGSNWLQRTPPKSPGARYRPALVYDLSRSRVVLLGGSDEPLDLWEWDGTTWLQRWQSAIPFALPLAYDAARARVVGFGSPAWAWATPLPHTWEWDGQQWMLRAPATIPVGRYGHAMAYDMARQRVVVFGGGGSSIFGQYLRADTWEWDGSNWTQRSPATSPRARSGHAMAYDIARQRVVLFGGGDLTTHLSDTWQWDGSTWVQPSPATNPSARSRHAMAYDEARQRVVLFGGDDGATSFADTWEWDGSGWLKRAPLTSPSARSSHTMAYDAARQRVVLFGGYGATSFADTWEWDGKDWAKLSTQRSPLHPYGSMAYDAARQRIVLCNGETWLLAPQGPAVAQPYGSACSGSSGPPLLTSSEPYLGNPGFRLELLSARPLSPCAVVLAAWPDSVAIGGGCTLYVKDPLLVPWVLLSNSLGVAATPPVAIPLDLTLRGSWFYAQAVVVDPQGPVGGLAFSAGRHLVVGD